MIVYVVLSLLVIIALIVLLSRKKKCTENYKKCICSQSMDKRECQDGDLVQKLYEDNVLTESTNLNSPGWTKVSPGDVDYPLSEGCPWPDESNKKGWSAWDFTDFVG